MSIQYVSIIGAGSMGQQIAMHCALKGFTTCLQDINEDSLINARKSLESVMSDWMKKGKITEESKQKAFNQIQFTQSLEEAMAKPDLVIEAVIEDLEIKRNIFSEIDKLVPSHTILATNSSTIVSSKIADVTNRADKVINMHFFYPPLVVDCIEVVRSEETSDRTVNQVLEFCESIDRTALLIEKEIYGFIANRILFAMLKEALYLYENGYSDFESIDIIIKKALGHRLGPFELMDLAGIDVTYYTQLQLYRETGDINDKPLNIIKDRVENGRLGRKTGKGWYNYPR